MLMDVRTITKKTEVFKKKKYGHKTLMVLFTIDHDSNVYDHTDILDGVVNPKVIAKYSKVNGKYNIPNIFEN